MFLYFVCLDDTAFSQSYDSLFFIMMAIYVHHWSVIHASLDKQGFALHCYTRGIDLVETNQSQPFRFFVYVLIRSKGAPRSRFVFHRTRSTKYPSKEEQGLFRESNSGAFQTANVILTLR